MGVEAEERVGIIKCRTMARGGDKTAVLPVADFGRVNGESRSDNHPAWALIFGATVITKYEWSSCDLDQAIAENGFTPAGRCGDEASCEAAGQNPGA
jgi:hypothetical protein